MIVNLKKIFEGEILTETYPTTLLQMFNEFTFHSGGIFKVNLDADDTFQGNS